MGIYSDIQADFKEEMDGDLADAVATLAITETESSTIYDPATGMPTSSDVISSMRCLVVDADMKDEHDPDLPTSLNDLEVMVLDSEKTCDFKLDLLATVRGSDYEVKTYKVDPAGATHSLELRKR